MSKKKTKFIPVFLILSICFSNHYLLSGQNLQQLFKTEKEVEKDLWKKERINYYLNEYDDNLMNPDGFFYRGQKKLQNGLYKEAIEDYKKAIKPKNFPLTSIEISKKTPTNKETYLRIGFCFQQLHQSDSALYYCQQSIEEDRYYVDAYMQTVQVLIDMDRLKDATAFLKESHAVFPNSKKIFFAQAWLYLYDGKISKTKRSLKKAIDIDIEYYDANVLLASIYIVEGRADQALDILTKSINSSNKPIGPLYYRAMMYVAMNELDKAYFDLNRAYHLDSIDNPIASSLMILDYYFENYTRANQIGLALWNTLLSEEAKLVRTLSYNTYEFGLFFDYISDSLASTAEISTFNTFLNKLVHEKPKLAIGVTEDFVRQYSASNFAKRLNILAHWIGKSSATTFESEYVYTPILSDEVYIPIFGPDYSRLIESVDNVLEQDSSLINMYWLKGICEFEQQNFEQAVAIASMAISIDSTFIEPYKIRAAANLRLKNYEMSISDYKYLTDLTNDDQIYQQWIALSMYKFGDFSDALAVNTELLASDPSNMAVKYNQGLCYEMNNLPDSALVYYEEVSNKFPSKTEYTRSVARAYKLKGKNNKALEVLIGAYNQEYPDLMLLVDIADFYVDLGNYEEAISYYKKAYRADRTYAYGYLGAANCYTELKDYKAALQLYDQAIESLPEHAYSYYAKGKCLAYQRKYKESNVFAFEATKLNDKYAAAFQLMAENFFYLSRYSISISMGIKALEYDPGNKEIMYQLAASTLARGNFDEALLLYKRVIETEDTVKSEDYTKAIEKLRFLIIFNIQAENAKTILTTVFGESE